LKRFMCMYLALLVAALSSAQAAWAAEASEEWEAAILEIESARCIGKLCLGLTLREAEALFGAATRGNPEDWDFDCTRPASPSRQATFIDHDRNEYDLAFTPLPGDGVIRERYRVSSISVVIDHGRIIKDILFGGLVRDWGLAQDDRPQALGIVSWSRSDRWSVTELHQVDVGTSGAALLKASLGFPRHSAWVGAGHVCRNAESGR